MHLPYFYGQYNAKVHGGTLRVVIIPDIPSDCNDAFICETFKHSIKLNTVSLLLKRWRLGVRDVLRKRKMHKALLEGAYKCQLVRVSPNAPMLPEVNEFLLAITGNVMNDPNNIKELVVSSCKGGQCPLLVAFFYDLEQGEDSDTSVFPLPDAEVLDVLKQVEAN